MAATATKICTICNTDCADRPRVKDEFGRYTCKACIDKQEAKAAAKSAGVKAPPKAGDDDEFDLRSAALLEAKSAAMDLPEAQCCPKCNGFMPNDQRLCMRCGFDRKRGAKVMTKVEKVKEEKDKRRSGGRDPMDYIGPGIGGLAILLGALSFISVDVGAIGFMVNVVFAIGVGLTVRICQARDGDWMWFILGWVVGVTDFVWVLMNERSWLKIAFFGTFVGLVLSGVGTMMNGGLGAGE